MSVRQNTVGSSYKPAVMWSFTVGFSLAPANHFVIFKLITGSESTSLSVLTNPAVMCPKYSESRCKDVGGNKQVPKKVITAIRILGGGQKLFGEVGRLYIYL